MKQKKELKFEVKFAAFEIYNENIYDLLKVNDKEFGPIVFNSGIISSD